MFEKRLNELALRLAEAEIDLGIITDDDSVYYYTGYYDYLHMEFGRPTILLVERDGSSTLVTPSMEADMARAAARVDHFSFWNDGAGDEWRADLPRIINKAQSIALEPHGMPPLVRAFVEPLLAGKAISDVTDHVSDMRMIKTEEELQLARHAGQVAMAMMQAGRETIAAGIPEYEVAIATSQAGTRAAAKLLTEHYPDHRMSPNTHFLQIMASGKDTTMPHHRASTRIMQKGEPVFTCFCGMTNFHRFKLGFDRTFWIEEIGDPAQRDIYEVAIASQRAAMDVLGPGVAAEDVHAAYADVIQTAGYEFPFRCGRATGFSFLEKPELVAGDKTILKPGMVFAVDGSVNDAVSFRAQVGDSFIITEDGYEQITDHPKAVEDVIIR